VPSTRAQAGDPERVIVLDMLRGVLALSVAVYHFLVVTRPFGGSVRDLVVIAGIYAVQTFFILSGVCFFHVYAGEPLSWGGLRGFFVKRLFRIAPLYYAAITIGLLLSSPLRRDLQPIRLLENLSLSFGFFHPNHALVAGGWSIGIEYVFYVALPLLVWLTQRRAVLYAVTLVLIALSVRHHFGSLVTAPEPERFHRYVAVANHGFLFLLGGVIVDLRKRWGVRLPQGAVLVPMGLFALAVIFFQPTFYDHYEVMVGPPRVKYVLLSWFVVLICALSNPPTASVLRRLGPLRTLGDWSYSVYLMHPFAWWLVARFAPTDAPGVALLVVAVLVTLLLAALSHRWIERPANALGHSLAYALAHRLASRRRANHSLWTAQVSATQRPVSLRRFFAKSS